MLAISLDGRDLLARFKQSLGAPFPFIPDEKGELVRRYGVKTPVVSLSLRFTFVVGPGRKVLKVEKGNEAIRPEDAIVACSITRH